MRCVAGSSLIDRCADENMFVDAHEKVKRRVEAIREKHASKVQPGGRKRGGIRTADNLLKMRNLFNIENLRVAPQHECDCGDRCCAWFDVEEVALVRGQTYGWLPNSQRSEEIFNDIEQRIEFNPVDGSITPHFYILRIEVCQSAYFFLRCIDVVL